VKDHDYMNDPRLDEYKDAPPPLREVRAWRLAEQDAKQGMTREQRKAYYEESRKETEALGFKFKYAVKAAPV